ncbi:MAG: DUF429 domain-containing protein [Planctomycetota bacterium]|nr:DUF429 domain-containing protein [Planctomycetota bacterium]
MSEGEDCVYGVDGCGDGRWVACRATRQGPREFRVFDSVDCLWQEARNAQLILVDVPIGMSWQKRQCDVLAKARLSRWNSRVYLVPHRDALSAEGRSVASAMNKARAGWGISAQSWAIRSLILGVDRFLAAKPEAPGRVRECHPEICFWALCGKNVVKENKQRPEGFQLRRGLLERVMPGIGSQIDDAIPRLRGLAKPDDIVDAAVAAWTAMAAIVAPDQLRTLPEIPPRDERGLPMEMVYRLA